MRKSSAFWLLVVQAMLAAALCGATRDRLEATPLDDAMTYWRAKAFHCTDNGKDFPSKERMPTAKDPSPCEDGDMTLFNGLLCAAGESIGCDAVCPSSEFLRHGAI
jgi:hypothetical protein